MGLDETGRFVAGDYVCTSFIDIFDLDILRNGISPNLLDNFWIVMNSKQLLNDFLEEHSEVKIILLELFKKPDITLKWLLTRKWQLSDEAPVDKLESDPESVLDILNRIQRGDFSWWIVLNQLKKRKPKKY